MHNDLAGLHTSQCVWLHARIPYVGTELNSIPHISYEHVHDIQLSKRPVVILRHSVHEKDGAEQWSVYQTQN